MKPRVRYYHAVGVWVAQEPTPDGNTVTYFRETWLEALAAVGIVLPARWWE